VRGDAVTNRREVAVRIDYGWFALGPGKGEGRRGEGRGGRGGEGVEGERGEGRGGRGGELRTPVSCTSNDT